MPPVLDKSTINASRDSSSMLIALDEESIRKHLDDQHLDNISNIHVFSTISSTNDFLLENELDNRQVAVCVAEAQTQGRGRYGHQWVSPAATNLYLSMSWSLKTWSNQYDALSLWLLITIAKLLERHGCANIQLKWPNDICVQNKKLAGILIERKVNQDNSNLVIGVGLNIAMSLNDDIDIETPWIDLLTIKPDWKQSRNELAAEVIAACYTTLSNLEDNQLSDLDSMWNQYDMLLNKKVEFLLDEKIKIGYAEGIDSLGQIILNIDGHVAHLHSSYISEIKIIGTSS